MSATTAAQSGDAARRSQAADAARAMSAGRFDDAARIYRELLQASPNEPGLLMNLGMALAMGGREAEAIAPLDRAVALDRGLVPAHLFLRIELSGPWPACEGDSAAGTRGRRPP